MADLYSDTQQAYLIDDENRSVGPDLGWIRAPFYTGPGYIPPKLPGPTPPVVPSPPLAP